MLATSSGRTLYLFMKDKSGRSACYGQCASYWPPLMKKGALRAGTGVKAKLLGTTKRKNGTLQVTYRGHPLYLFKLDHASGQIAGQGQNFFGGNGIHFPLLMVAIALVVVLALRWPLSYAAYAAATLLVSLSAHRIGSSERYLFATFPFVLAIVSLTRSRRVETATLVASAYLSLSAMAVRSFHAIVELLSTSGLKSHGVIPQQTMSPTAVMVAVRSEPVRSAISPK